MGLGFVGLGLGSGLSVRVLRVRVGFRFAFHASLLEDVACPEATKHLTVGVRGCPHPDPPFEDDSPTPANHIQTHTLKQTHTTKHTHTQSES